MPEQTGTPSVADPEFPIPDLDISMVKLKEDIRYYNTTFTTPFDTGIKLTKLRDEKDRVLPEKVSLDSCFTGRLKGTIEAQHIVIRTYRNSTEIRLQNMALGKPPRCMPTYGLGTADHHIVCPKELMGLLW